MKTWCKILPFFFIEWFAKRKCERFNLFGDEGFCQQYVSPFKKVIFITKEYFSDDE